MSSHSENEVGLDFESDGEYPGKKVPFARYFLDHFVSLTSFDQIDPQIYLRWSLPNILTQIETFYCQAEPSERFYLFLAFKNLTAAQVLGLGRIHLATAFSYHFDCRVFLAHEDPLDPYWETLQFSDFGILCSNYRDFFDRHSTPILQHHNNNYEYILDRGINGANTAPGGELLKTIPFYISFLTGLSWYLETLDEVNQVRIEELVDISCRHLYFFCKNIGIFPLKDEPSTLEDFLGVVLDQEILNQEVTPQGYIVYFFQFILQGEFTRQERLNHLSDFIEVLMNRAHLRYAKSRADFTFSDLEFTPLRLVPFPTFNAFVEGLRPQKAFDARSLDLKGVTLVPEVPTGMALVPEVVGVTLVPINLGLDDRIAAGITTWACGPTVDGDEPEPPAEELFDDPVEPALSLQVPPSLPPSTITIRDLTAGSVMAVFGACLLALLSSDHQAAHVQAASSENVVAPSTVSVSDSNPSSIPAGLQVINPGLIPPIDADASVIRSFLAELTTADALAVFYCPWDEQMQDLQVFSRNPFKFIYELDGELLVRLDSWAFTREYTLSCDGLSPNTYYGKPLFREVTLN